MSAYTLIAFAVSIGFVTAGAIGNFHQLVTNNPPTFETIFDKSINRLWLVIMIVFAGPFILMRNAIRGRRIEGRPLKWLAATSMISAGWSFAVGTLIINVIITLQTGWTS